MHNQLIYDRLTSNIYIKEKLLRLLPKIEYESHIKLCYAYLSNISYALVDLPDAITLDIIEQGVIDHLNIEWYQPWIVVYQEYVQWMKDSIIINYRNKTIDDILK